MVLVNSYILFGSTSGKTRVLLFSSNKTNQNRKRIPKKKRIEKGNRKKDRKRIPNK